MPANSRRRNLPNPIAKRIRATTWTAIALATVYAVVLVTSTVWEGKAPPWVAVALEHRAGLLALVAATFGLLAIIVPTQTMPKAFLTTVVAGGLTGAIAGLVAANIPMAPINGFLDPRSQAGGDLPTNSGILPCPRHIRVQNGNLAGSRRNAHRAIGLLPRR